MTMDEFDASYRGFCARRPFRAFLVEFNSGHQLRISHPEAVRKERGLYVMRAPDGGSVVFPPESVCRLLDLPLATPN